MDTLASSCLKNKVFSLARQSKPPRDRPGQTLQASPHTCLPTCAARARGPTAPRSPVFVLCFLLLECSFFTSPSVRIPSFFMAQLQSSPFSGHPHPSLEHLTFICTQPVFSAKTYLDRRPASPSASFPTEGPGDREPLKVLTLGPHSALAVGHTRWV